MLILITLLKQSSTLQYSISYCGKDEKEQKMFEFLYRFEQGIETGPKNTETQKYFCLIVEPHGKKVLLKTDAIIWQLEKRLVLSQGIFIS